MTQRGFRDRFLSSGCHLLRYLPKGRSTGFRILRRLAGNPERFILAHQAGLFVVDCLDWDVAIRVALYKSYEPVPVALFLAGIQPGDVVVDVGANKGYYALLAAQRIGPSGKIVAFEADPRNLVDLKETAGLNGLQNFYLVDKAAARGKGTARFDQQGWTEGISAWGGILRDSETKKAWIEVETCSIDEALENLKISRVNHMKMDIQGGEKDAIPGMQRLLEAGRLDVLLLELHDTDLSEVEIQEILRFMRQAGYTAQCFEQPEFSDTEALQALERGHALALDGRGYPLEAYDYHKRMAASKLKYVHPVQMRFTRK